MQHMHGNKTMFSLNLSYEYCPTFIMKLVHKTYIAWLILLYNGQLRCTSIHVDNIMSDSV